MANLGDLALLAGLVYGVRDQRRQASRARQREETERAEDRRLRLDQFAQQKIAAQKQQELAEREAARQEATPFLQVLTASDSADRLYNMGQQGTLGPFLRNAQSVFQRANIPFDLSGYMEKQPGVDVSSLLAGGQAPPVGAPAEGLGTEAGPSVSPAGTLAGLMGGQPVSRAPGSLPGPGSGFAKIAGVEPLAPGRKPAAPRGLGEFALAALAEPTAQAVPAEGQGRAMLEWDEAEAYRERYQQPGALTQSKIENTASQMAHRVAQQGLWRTQEEKNQAVTETTRLLAQPRANLMLEQAGYLDQQTKTMALLTQPRIRETVARAVAMEGLPEYRQGMLGLGGERNALGWAGLEQDRELGFARIRSAESIASANREARALESSLKNQVPQASRPFLNALARLTTATRRTAAGTQRALTPGERRAAEHEINEAHRKATGRPLFGDGGVLPSAASPFGNIDAGADAGTAAVDDLMGGMLGSGQGAPAPSGSPDAGSAAAPAGDNVGFIGKMSAQEYEQYYKNAPNSIKAAIKRDRAEAIRRGLVPGAKAGKAGAAGARASAGPADAGVSGTTDLDALMAELDRTVQSKLGSYKVPPVTPTPPDTRRKNPAADNRTIF